MKTQPQELKSKEKKKRIFEIMLDYPDLRNNDVDLIDAVWLVEFSGRKNRKNK
jgi:hypothetical protein